VLTRESLARSDVSPRRPVGPTQRFEPAKGLLHESLLGKS
jgi:hypothetical protein